MNNTKLKQHGIYCIKNLQNDKRFVASTSSIRNAYKNVVHKLDRQLHKNKRLQEAWDKYGSHNFIFEILEVDPIDSVFSKENWINHFRSNEIEYGYNLELIKRPWEQQRDIWLSDKSWGVDGSVGDVLKEIFSKLDYDLEFAEDRVNHLYNILTEHEMDWLINYVSSPLFVEKQIKTKNDFLTEDDTSLILMSYIVDYLVFPKYLNQTEKDKKTEREHYIREKKSTVKADHTRGHEILFEDIKKLDKLHSSEIIKKHKVNTKHIITVEDLEKYPELKQMNDTVSHLKQILGYGKSKEEREKNQVDLENKYSSNQIRMMKQLYRDLMNEMQVVKEKLVGTIRFKHLSPETTVFNYDNDTGYFDENEDYILVSENKIDFSIEKHVLELINHYSLIRQSVADNPDHDLWTILFVLDELIEKANFEDYIKHILICKIDGHSYQDIVESINDKYGIELTKKRISNIYNKTIPKIIVETYLQDKEDWLFTFKIKGTYKTCSKCKETKLANERHFSPDNKRPDGLFPYCKKCNK